MLPPAVCLGDVGRVVSPLTKLSIWIGFDPREAASFAVTRYTAKLRLTQPIPVHGLVLSDLQARGLYTRKIQWRLNALGKMAMWDVISESWQSTEHANTRFLVPHLAKSGWALFMDGDILVRQNLTRVFDDLDPRYAAYCVKHQHDPAVAAKMDDQEQTRYARKNWSSFIVFNCDHPANETLTVAMVNTLPGRDLHRLCWLNDNEIGELDSTWNHLNGITAAEKSPAVVHFTEGTPDMPGYEDVEFAPEWREALRRWAR